MTKNYVYSIPYSFGREYNGVTSRTLNGKLEEHRKEIVRGEIMKLGIVHRIWREKSNHRSLWNEVKILNREEHYFLTFR